MSIKKTIYLNAGHDTIRDPGAITQFGREIDFNIKIRDALVPQLIEQGFKVVSVPDELGLGESIKFVNKYAKNLNSGLAFSIHCNAGGGEGAEAFYYKDDQASKNIAKKLIDAYCEETGLKNRGAKSDTLARHGQLGWIRRTNIWSVLIEVGFLDNIFDVKKLKDYKKIAKGICQGVCKIFGILSIDKNIDTDTDKTEPKDKMAEIKKLARQIIKVAELK